jgi:hypothetical protein
MQPRLPYVCSTRNRTRKDANRFEALSAQKAMDRYGYDGLEEGM